MEAKDPFAGLLKKFPKLTVVSQLVFFLPTLIIVILTLLLYATLLLFFSIDMGIRKLFKLKQRR